MLEIEMILKHIFRDKLEYELTLAYHRDFVLFLPQSWVFQTEYETIALIITEEGTVRIQSGYVDHPDVFVAWENENLTRLLFGSIPRREIAEGRSPYLEVSSEKGMEGFRRFAGLLGFDPEKDMPTGLGVGENDEFS
jgi:hypothetical protein